MAKSLASSQKTTVLFTWELGSGFGHLGRLLPVMRHLHQLGCRVVLAAVNLEAAALLPSYVELLPAPKAAPPSPGGLLRRPATFADVLFNEGACGDGLPGVVQAWRGLFHLLRPQVVVHDYSPFALLAMQGLDCAKALLGTGFACPPPLARLPDLRDWENQYRDRMARTEAEVLEALNRQLVAQGQPSLQGVGELSSRVEANFLATFAELDHYPDRANTEYRGVWPGFDPDQRHRPEWPAGEGKRIFVYLKAFRGLTRLLSTLERQKNPVLACIPGGGDYARTVGSSVRVMTQPLDIDSIAPECDLAILNAGHGSTASVLLAGRPILQLPINVEQYHTARNTCRLGAGEQAFLDQDETMIHALERLLESEEHRLAAADFARRYQDFDPKEAIANVASEILALDS